MGVKVYEAEVDLVARQLAPIVQTQQDLVPHQLEVDLSHTLLQSLVQLK